jgi:hypothetical protein
MKPRELKIKYYPERWIIFWEDEDYVQHQESFDFKEDAIKFKQKLLRPDQEITSNKNYEQKN